MLAPGSIRCLLNSVDGQYAECGGDAGGGMDRSDPLGSLACDVFKVRGVAADHRAEAHHRVDVAEARQFPRRDGNLERAWDPDHLEVARGDAALPQRLDGAVEQACGDDVVEAPDDDA